MNPFLEDDISRVPPDVADLVRRADSLLEGTGFWIVRQPTLSAESMESQEFRDWLDRT